jgi:hypothetical protein
MSSEGGAVDENTPPIVPNMDAPNSPPKPSMGLDEFLVTKKAVMNSANKPKLVPEAEGGAKKKGGEVLVFDDGPGCGVISGGGGMSLQENFKRFRKQKVKERRIMLQNKEELATKGARTQEFKDALREKFIMQAKKYIGVPYAERYKKPEDPIAPLYLDCCGLVRKVVQDLAEDFGFLIGRWNQAYMFDTLPNEVPFEELKPGDLIFYEANFTNPDRCKAQKHNMTHVEIFLGGDSGRATLGSRYFRGAVNIYPDYEFPCTTWKCYKHHFRSLDTWLDGICQSTCEEHPWIIDSGLMLDAAAGKRSIFGYDSDDDNAGGYEEDDGAEDMVTPIESETTPVKAKRCSCSLAAAATAEEAETSKVTPTNMNDSDEEAGPVMPTLNVTVEPEISGARTKTPSPSNTAAASTSMLQRTETGGSKPLLKRSEVSASMTAIPAPPTYYVGKANGWKLVKASMDKRGWQQLPFEYEFSSRFGMKWVERRSQIDYRTHTPGQLVCHIPNNEVITTKIGLLSTLRERFSKQKKLDSNVRLPTPWLPETYQLDIPTDVQAVLQENKDRTDKGETPIWIYKPSCMNRGTGIKVISGEEDLKLCCLGKPANKRAGEEAIPPSKGIVQQYLRNQLLIKNAMDPMPIPGVSQVGAEDHGSYKFDYRCYLLIARNQPNMQAFFHPGYCRLTTKPYSDDLALLSDNSIHLTNASVQKKQDNYKENEEVKDRQTQSLEMLAQRLEADGHSENARYLREDFHTDVKRSMVDVLKASHAKFIRKAGYFDLFGLDFMVSSDNKCFLIEANTNPALATSNDVMKEVIPDAVDGAIELVLGLQGPQRKEIVPKAPTTDAAAAEVPASTKRRGKEQRAVYDLDLIEKNDEPVLAAVPGRWELLFNEKANFYWKPAATAAAVTTE